MGDTEKKTLQGNVFHITSSQEYEMFVSRSMGNNIPLFIKFTASWCGPCKMIAPEYKCLAEQFPEAIFLEVDVDALSDLSTYLGITAMPTFWVIQNGKRIREMKGANKIGLNNMVKNVCEKL